MSIFVVGDVQGCFSALQRLLTRAGFRDDCDELWLVGDLINRGPASRDTLAFLYARRANLRCVLGNHDLHLLAVFHGQSKAKKSDTLAEILADPACAAWCDWLITQPLLHHAPEHDAVMVHAGIPPCWDLPTATQEAAAVSAALRDHPTQFFADMYGNEPARWADDLRGNDRLRYTVNALTRMRLIRPDGGLDLSSKDEPGAGPVGHRPWFAVPDRQPIAPRILFGHWAALNGRTLDPRVIGLDTGCVWGNALSGLWLDREDRIWVPA